MSTSELLTFDQKQDAIIRYFERNFTRPGSPFNTDVAAQCQMFTYGFTNAAETTNAVFTYFKGMDDIYYPLKQLVEWRNQSFGDLSSFLDFASGFGRLTRRLTQEIDPSRIWVSEIQEEAVRFQEKEFSVNGLVSTTNPGKFPEDKKFSCILVVSLFTHLPEKRFVQWLKKLLALLEPGGMLIFTVHDQSNVPHLDISKTGIHFNPHVSEVVSIEASEYGSTHVSEAFVRRAVKNSTRRRHTCHRFPKGLWHHDIYVVSTETDLPQPDIGLVGPLFPLAACDGNLSGWIYDTTAEGRIDGVEIVKCGEPIDASCASFYGDGRFMPNGWKEPRYFQFSNLGDLDFDTDIIVRAVSTKGKTRDFPIWIRGT